MTSDLDEQVRLADEDRWLASRFAQKPARARLIAVYAVDLEISKTARAVREGALGDIRLAWWSENVAKALSGAAGPHDHPALDALAQAHAETPLSPAVFEALIAAHEKDFEEAPFATWAELESYIDAAFGGPMALAFEACGPVEMPVRQRESFLRAGGRAWGYARLARALEAWTARRATFFPENLIAHVGLNLAALFDGVHDHASRAATMAVVDRSRNYYRQAQDMAALLPAPLFPAFGYLRLLRGQLRSMSGAAQQEPSFKSLPLLLRQMEMIAASAVGRV